MEKTKATLHIPTGIDFEFIEVAVWGTPEEIRAQYKELVSTIRPTREVELVPSEDFCVYLQSIIDSDLTEWGTVEDYNALSNCQQQVMQSLKRFKQRI